MTTLLGKSCADTELLNFARKGLLERSRLLTSDATLAALQDLKLWVSEELAFEENAAASFGRILSELWHAEYLDQVPPLLNRFERLASAYFVRRGSVTAFHEFCNAWREGVLRRVLLFAEEEPEVAEYGHPPVQCALLAAGTLGRLEQTLEEADTYFLIRGDGDAGYFDRFAYRVLAIMDHFGLLSKSAPASPSRPLWHGSLEEWESHLGDDGELGALSERIRLLSELRYICGDERTGREVVAIGRLHLEHWREDEQFGEFAKEAAAEQVALGLFGGIRVERAGEHPGCLHLWDAALNPLISVVRLLAVQHRLPPGPTLARLGTLSSMGLLEPELAERVESAYHLFAGLKIGKEITLEQPYVNPTDLSAPDQQRLKGALETVRQLQRVVRRNQLDKVRQSALALTPLSSTTCF